MKKSLLILFGVLIAIGAASVATFYVTKAHYQSEGSDHAHNLPSIAALAPPAGSVAGFFTPAGALPDSVRADNASYIASVNAAVGKLGLSARWSPHSFGRVQYYGGTDEERAGDIMGLVAADDVKLMVANRGGYGCVRTLDRLDYGAIARARKPVMGYSDLTALLTAIHTKTGLITFHGPMGGGWDDVTVDSVRRVVLQGEAAVLRNTPAYPISTITPGRARGRLLGGNLSVFTSLLGSPYAPADYRGALLFFEEVGEAAYQIDRMIMTLQVAGILDQINGFVFGTCSNCPWSGTADHTWTDVLQQRIKPLGVPAFYGAMFGHDMASQYVLPIGALAEIDADDGTITLLQSAVDAS